MQSFIFNRLFDGLLSSGSGGNAAEGHQDQENQGVDVGGGLKGEAKAGAEGWGELRAGGRWKGPGRTERTAGPAGRCISHALASVTSPTAVSNPRRRHHDGLNTFHVGIFNFMAANYSAALRSLSVSELSLCKRTRIRRGTLRKSVP